MHATKLPIGIQSFEKIRSDRYAYVDKTGFILDLVNRGSYYFLSRPRRFGKSLFLDTLDCAFSGREELFTDLTLSQPEAGWVFTRHPVLRVDFAGGTTSSPTELRLRLDRLITSWEERFQTSRTEGSPGERLIYLVPQIAAQWRMPVVILIDEYDKPILDNLKDPVLASEMRDVLKDFYGAIKPLDADLKFVFLTGITKFAKTGIFSGLNNLKDITLDRRYSSICGYTVRDLQTVFSSWMDQHDSSLVEMWYNGYSWTGEKVYNPFDILLFLDEGIFKSYWFETGTPTFLVRLLMEKHRSLPELDTLLAEEELIGSFRLDDVQPETLLFQAGYLTIRGGSGIGEKTFYSLGFPNLEVKSAFSSLTLGFLTKAPDISGIQRKIDIALSSGDTDLLKAVFHSFFASIPHDWYRRNQLSGYEGYYTSIVYAYFASLGYHVIAEDATNKGKVDLTVISRFSIWIFEFKIQRGEGISGKSPLHQVIEMGYAEKYRSDGRPVYQVGIVFDPEARNIVTWEVIR